MRAHCRDWTEFFRIQHRMEAVRPERLFMFYTIAGDHRRMACIDLFENGDKEHEIEPGRAQFGTCFSNLMFQLELEQAKCFGGLDNIRKVQREQEPIDIVMLAQDRLASVTIDYLLEKPETFANWISVLKTTTLQEVRMIPGYAETEEPTDSCHNYPMLQLIKDCLVFNPRTRQLLFPLRKAFNRKDVIDLIYNEIVGEDTHKIMADIRKNAKTKKTIKNAISMALHGNTAVQLLLQIDEDLKAELITPDSTEPKR
jgi:hypothetical protein